MEFLEKQMRSTFNIKPLVTAITALSVASIASAAGLSRSEQDVSAFLQDGTYAETVYTYIDADVTGKDKYGNKIKDIAESYDYFRYGVKTDINDTFSVGVLYDEPWGAAADYTGNNIFVAQGDKDATVKHISEGQLPNYAAAGAVYNDLLTKFENATDEATKKALGSKLKEVGATIKTADHDASIKGEETKVEVRTESLTGLVGMKFGQNKEFQVYGGPVAQRLKANVNLRGNAYLVLDGYDLNVNPETDYGWIAGFQYTKPEIGLKAALTYRSEIDYDIPVAERVPVSSTPELTVTDMKVTTPESVNFDFQTGINPTTLATAKVRWVPWSDFAVTPPLYNKTSKEKYPQGLDLINYDDDQWLVELGLAKRVADNLAISGTVGWDSGAGNPVTSLGPVEGYYSVGLGAKYDMTKNWSISAGGKYLWIGDAKGNIPNGAEVSTFEDNDGYALGIKLSYQDK